MKVAKRVFTAAAAPSPPNFHLLNVTQQRQDSEILHVHRNHPGAPAGILTCLLSLHHYPSLASQLSSMSQTRPRRPVTRADFEIAIICALPLEADAVAARALNQSFLCALSLFSLFLNGPLPPNSPRHTPKRKTG